MAVWQWQPDAGLIVHADRGSQYASKVYGRLLQANGFIGSVSRKGDCWDSAVAESFFISSMKERAQWRRYQTRVEAQRDILDYIVMSYNSRRLHSMLGYTNLNDYDSAAVELRKAA
jgi:transposase InsO family protein